LVERNLAKVEVESSRLFSRSKFLELAKLSKRISTTISKCGKNAGVAQLVERNLAKVEVESSRLFSRSKFLELAKLSKCSKNAGVAQLVERNLAKVEVESSRLFSRSNDFEGKQRFPFLLVRESAFYFDFSFRQIQDRIATLGGVAKWLCSGLQSR
jgi:hypothetical protein